MQPSAADRILIVAVGREVVELFARKRLDEMVSCKPPEITSVPIRNSNQEAEAVAPSSDMVLEVEFIGVSFGR